MALVIEKDASTDGYLIRVKGEVDLYSSPELREAITEAVPKATREVIVDLAGVPYMDSSGVATLVEGFRSAKAKSAGFVLLSPSTQVLKVLQLAKLDTIFEIRDGA